MNIFSPAKIASAYRLITSIESPAGLMPGWEIESRSLLCSVHPRLHDILDLCAKACGPSWELARSEVERQREIRSSLFQWISQLDKQLTEDENYIFPDPYSLLLWLWTFQVFTTVVCQPGEVWSKFFYRGEARDYGDTQFTPTIARKNPSDRGSLTWLLAGRSAIADEPRIRSACAAKLGLQISNDLLESMSLTQTLAIHQHYGQDTPLVDVTTNPEVALYFATKRHDGDVGIVGYWQCSGRGEDSKRIALVMAPPIPIFERLHRQSGYFLCTGSSQPSPLVALRFRHCCEVEPIRPNWLASIGKCGGSDDEILGDPYDISGLIQSTGLLNSEHTYQKAPQPRDSTKEDFDNLLRFAISSIGGAAGRVGVQSRGRFVEILPTLVYSLFRYAPAHFLILTKVLKLTFEEVGLSSIRPIVVKIVETLRAVVSTEPAAQLLRLGISDDELIDVLMSHSSSDDTLPPWPISDWYQ